MSLMSEEEVVEELTREYLVKLVDKLQNFTVGYLKGIPKHFRRHFILRPTLELNVNTFEWGVEASVRVYFDGLQIMKLKDAIRKQLEDNRLRIKTYADIVKMRVKGSSSELYALLSNLRSSPSTGNRETGVPREEVRGQEGGPVPEDTGESNI
jgi:hypothetical protein